MQNAENIYEEIQVLIQAGKEEDAVRELERLVSWDPSFAKAFNDLGVLYYHRKEKARAAAVYRRAVSIEPENIIFLKNLADFLAVEEGKIEEALRLYNRILEQDPADVETLLALGHICRSLDRTEDARDFYNRALDAEPWNSDAWECLEKLNSTGLNADAVPANGPEPRLPYEIEETPGEGCRKAQEMAEAGREEEAVDDLEEMRSRYPEYARVWNDLGVLCYRRGDKEKAGENYRKAVSLEPENSLFVKNLADFLFVEEGRTEDALRMYVKLMETDPADVELLLNLGHICTSLTRFEDAEHFYRKSLDVEPWNHQAAEALEKLPELKAKSDKMNVSPDSAALPSPALAPDDGGPHVKSAQENIGLQKFPWIEHATALRHKGRHDDAAIVLENGLEQSPGQADLTFCLAETHMEADRFAEALEALERRLDETCLDEKRHVRHMELVGCCLEAMGRKDETLVKAEKILWRSPTSAHAWNLKGKIAYAEGFPGAAEGLFKQAVGCDPSFGEAYTHLGKLKRDNGDPGEALRLFEIGFLLSPDQVACARDYHAAVCELKAFARAEPIFRNAASSHPLHRTIRFLWIDLLIRQEKYADALSEIRDVLALLGPEDGVISAGLDIKKNKIRHPEKIQAMRRPKISLCMIAKDEAEHIAGCLASVGPAVDEIVLVDTGSTDRTANIAAIFDAKLYHFPWTDDFAEARNFSLSKATGEWILVMDPDERLSASDRICLRETVESALPETAFSITTRNYTHRANTVGWRENGGEYPEEAAGCGWFPSVKVRLFPRDVRIRFRHPVHEMVEQSLNEAGFEIRSCSISIHHYGKLNEAKNIEKTTKYFEISKRKLETMAGDPGAVRELAVQAGYLEKYEVAVNLWEKFLTSRPDTPEALVNLGSAYWNLGKYNEAKEISHRAAVLAPQMKEAHLNFAMSDLFLGNVNDAISVLEPLVVRNPEYLSARFMLAAACCMNGKLQKGIQELKALRNTAAGPSLAISIDELAGKLTRANQAESARKLRSAVAEMGK